MTRSSPTSVKYLPETVCHKSMRRHVRTNCTSFHTGSSRTGIQQQISARSGDFWDTRLDTVLGRQRYDPLRQEEASNPSEKQLSSLGRADRYGAATICRIAEPRTSGSDTWKTERDRTTHDAIASVMRGSIRMVSPCSSVGAVMSKTYRLIAILMNSDTSAKYLPGHILTGQTERRGGHAIHREKPYLLP